MTDKKQWMQYSPEVEQALRTGEAPVVGLESTIISHGMPYPENLKMAQSLESIIRAQGAVPATIALWEGKIKIGLSAEELAAFALPASAQNHRKIVKVTRSDIPTLLTNKGHGATTVSATMFCAHLAQIAVFVTGGIGGVHREVQQTWDISSDLTELGQTPVAVVCAGVKSILDIPRTAEYLETLGVPVLGLGTDELPAFYTPKSGVPVSARFDEVKEVAQFMNYHWGLGMQQGVVVANPIPLEHALDKASIDLAIEKSLQEMQQKNIRGKDVTPFLLQNVKNLTAGKSLQANIALVQHNALKGAQLALAYHQLLL